MQSLREQNIPANANCAGFAFAGTSQTGKTKTTADTSFYASRHHFAFQFVDKVCGEKTIDDSRVQNFARLAFMDGPNLL